MEAIDILAIDDDKIVQKVVRRALEPEGFNVRTADDGESGLEQALSAPPHIVLLDVEMPGMNGYQVCEKLVEQEAFHHIPIVFLSAHSTLQERMLGYEMGADDFVVKPFEAVDLVARMRVLLKYAAEQKELHTQVQLAQQAALAALSSTSELGQAMSFMERSIIYNSIDELADGMLEVASNLALDCRLMVETQGARNWYSSSESISPLEKELIEMSDRRQRFADFGASTLVNYPVASLLVTNMPLHDAERYGRIKDLLPLLLSGLSAKVHALATQTALRNHTEQLDRSVSRIRNSLYHLGSTMLDNQKAAGLSVQSMIQKLEEDLLRMGLEEDEEQYLIHRIDESAESAVAQMDVGAEVGLAFRFVHEHLKQVAHEQQALMTTFDEIMSKQQDVSHAASGDIELF